jgi:hypothetical protein
VNQYRAEIGLNLKFSPTVIELAAVFDVKER